VEGKAYRVFSIKYAHPSEPGEDAWQLFSGSTEHPILIDKETIATLKGHEIQWLCVEASEHNKEPTIMACELSLNKDLDTINDNTE
jgi:hypothetical protein